MFVSKFVSLNHERPPSSRSGGPQDSDSMADEALSPGTKRTAAHAGMGDSGEDRDQRRKTGHDEEEDGELLPSAVEEVRREVEWVHLLGPHGLIVSIEPCAIFSLLTKSTVLSQASVYRTKAIPFDRLIPCYGGDDNLLSITGPDGNDVESDEEWFEILASAACKSAGSDQFLVIGSDILMLPTYTRVGENIYVKTDNIVHSKQYASKEVDTTSLFASALKACMMFDVNELQAARLRSYASLVFTCANAVTTKDSASYDTLIHILESETPEDFLARYLTAYDGFQQASMRELLATLLVLVRKVTNVSAFLALIKDLSFESIKRTCREIPGLQLPEVVTAGTVYCRDKRGNSPLDKALLSGLKNEDLVLVSQSKATIERIGDFASSEVEVYPASSAYYKGTGQNSKKFQELKQAKTTTALDAKTLQAVLVEAKARDDAKSAAGSSSAPGSGGRGGKGKQRAAGHGKGRGYVGTSL